MDEETPTGAPTSPPAGEEFAVQPNYEAAWHDYRKSRRWVWASYLGGFVGILVLLSSTQQMGEGRPTEALGSADWLPLYLG